ncbi:MAG TPA: porphobilinogen synthase [Chitinophagales bacterium]|nr:porphobilinogen synthase [Chitinophagales bacterium]
MLIRPRRNRMSEAIRNMVSETSISAKHLVQPLFVVDGKNINQPITSLPGMAQLSIDQLLKEVEDCMKNGLTNFMLFPAVKESLKDSEASYGHNPRNFYLNAIRSIKQEFPETCLISDVAMDPYSSDGHDGLLVGDHIDNDRSLPILAAMSLAQCDAGIDILGPSDMMDGRVGYIREVLDDQGFQNTGIMSYSAKYASAFYGPFRDALDSAPKKGNKKTYQMNPANKREALIEAQLDMEEGADFLMIKPALHYLDVIQTIREHFNLPVVAYHVSGEYAMLRAAAQNGWLDYDQCLIETLISLRRAGSDVIISYGAKDFVRIYK